eukprot:SAG31_NODE_5079_length_2752_cov_4.966114_1_plen_127_part_10
MLHEDSSIGLTPCAPCPCRLLAPPARRAPRARAANTRRTQYAAPARASPPSRAAVLVPVRACYILICTGTYLLPKFRYRGARVGRAKFRPIAFDRSDCTGLDWAYFILNKVIFKIKLKIGSVINEYN